MNISFTLFALFLFYFGCFVFVSVLRVSTAVLNRFRSSRELLVRRISLLNNNQADVLWLLGQSFTRMCWTHTHTHTHTHTPDRKRYLKKKFKQMILCVCQILLTFGYG